MNELMLNKEIYNQKDIMQAIQDYILIADILVSNNSDSYLLLFKNSRIDMEKTMKEFENYLIDLSNVKMK